MTIKALMRTSTRLEGTPFQVLSRSKDYIDIRLIVTTDE